MCVRSCGVVSQGVGGGVGVMLPGVVLVGVSRAVLVIIGDVCVRACVRACVQACVRVCGVLFFYLPLMPGLSISRSTR